MQRKCNLTSERSSCRCPPVLATCWKFALSFRVVRRIRRGGVGTGAFRGDLDPDFGESNPVRVLQGEGLTPQWILE